MTANQLTNMLLIEIVKAYPKRARVWRNNVVAAKVGDRFVRAGIPGQADITGIIDGRRLEIEVKVGKDRMSKKQWAFAHMIREMGGIYIVAYHFDEFMNRLREIAG